MLEQFSFHSTIFPFLMTITTRSMNQQIKDGQQHQEEVMRLPVNPIPKQQQKLFETM